MNSKMKKISNRLDSEQHQMDYMIREFFAREKQLRQIPVSIDISRLNRFDYFFLNFHTELLNEKGELVRNKQEIEKQYDPRIFRIEYIKKTAVANFFLKLHNALLKGENVLITNRYVMQSVQETEGALSDQIEKFKTAIRELPTTLKNKKNNIFKRAYNYLRVVFSKVYVWYKVRQLKRYLQKLKKFLSDIKKSL